jgi:hypothetical protein
MQNGGKEHEKRFVAVYIVPFAVQRKQSTLYPSTNFSTLPISPPLHIGCMLMSSRPKMQQRDIGIKIAIQSLRERLNQANGSSSRTTVLQQPIIGKEWMQNKNMTVYCMFCHAGCHGIHCILEYNKTPPT